MEGSNLRSTISSLMYLDLLVHNWYPEILIILYAERERVNGHVSVQSENEEV